MTWFGDTHYYLALANANDAAHAAARDFSQRAAVKIVTTAWVLVELADALCSPSARNVFVELHGAMRADPNLEIVGADQDLLDAALELYRAGADKAWSLTDCTSFVVMERQGLTEALTADHHFEQAGFVALLKD